MNPIIVIPSRLNSTRLPRKALADIGGKPMIARVVERVAPLGLPFVVATDSEEIAHAVEREGARAVMTPEDCPSGSDRIWAAMRTLDPAGSHDIIVNVQGDMPTLDARIIKEALQLMHNKAVDIATLAAVIRDDAELMDTAVVKVAIGGEWMVDRKQTPPSTPHPSPFTGKALYFSRAPIPHGATTHYHHIGIYAYRSSALERFVALPPSPLEQAEKLEQLRALEASMRIDVAVVDTVPLGVDTAEGLERARKAINSQTTKKDRQ